METNNDEAAEAPTWGFGEKLLLAALTVVGVAGVLAAPAAATTGSVTSMATTAAGDLSPIILGVGGALVAVAVVRFGVRWVLSSIGRGGRA